MITALKAEFLKLLSVRSTYVIVVIAAALAGAVSFYAQGYSADPRALQAPNYLASQVTGAISAVAIIGSLVGVLLLANEYRYNTILYTLTASPSRVRVLLAKFLTVSSFMIVFTFFISLLTVACTWLGVQLKGNEFGPQTFEYGELIWRTLYYGWGFGILALALTAIIRNQVGAIIALLIIPTVVESFLGLVLKDNVSYLPFSALNTILFAATSSDTQDAGKHLIVSVATIFGMWVLAFTSFIKRDAN